jgi:hypothetical protein
MQSKGYVKDRVGEEGKGENERKTSVGKLEGELGTK